MPPDGYRGRRSQPDTCYTIKVEIENSRPDPDLALIETVIASDMNDHAKVRVIERILR